MNISLLVPTKDRPSYVKRLLKYYSDLEKRIPRSEMDSWNEFFTVILNLTIKSIKNKPKGIKMQLVGSYRREAESSGDIDILLTSRNPDEGKKLMTEYIKQLLKTDNFDKSLVFSSGTTKFMGLGKIEDYYRHVDIFYLNIHLRCYFLLDQVNLILK